MVDTEGIAAVILAAGYSFQMKKFKPLMKLGDITAIEHSVRCFYYAGINDIRVVVGYRALDVIEAVKRYLVRLVLNSRYSEGMYSSVQEGVRSLEPDIQAFFVLPADIPLVRVDTVQKMLACFHSSEGTGIVYPVFKGHRGHPPLISTKYSDAILNDKGICPGGLRSLSKRFEHEAVDVEVADQGVLLDMNTQEDYFDLLNYLGTSPLRKKAPDSSKLRVLKVKNAGTG